MKPDTSIYTHYAKIKRCIESCETLDQVISCYNMVYNVINLYGIGINTHRMYNELGTLLKNKNHETKHI